MNAAAPVVLGHLGPIGDHDDRAPAAVRELARAAAAASGRAEVRLFGDPSTPATRTSREHLDQARPDLLAYADAVTEQLDAGHALLAVNGRCAASLASLPRVVRARPDAVVVWLDAHADLNVPASSRTDYLGGMAVSGPLGWWDTGLGAGLAVDRLVLVGTRSIDAEETDLIQRYGVQVVPVGAPVDAVLDLVAGRPVVVHLDCDVLEPGVCRTDYVEPGGLSLSDLADLAEGLARRSPVVGLEVAEWEGPDSASAAGLLDALAPLLS